MESYSFQDYLRESLHQLFPDAKDDGARNNVLINCPLCIKEGRPDTKHHMSICLGNEGKPLFYNCFRNNSHRGILTPDTLLQLAWNTQSIIDPVLLEAIDNFNKHTRHYSRYTLNRENRLSIDFNTMKNNDEMIEVKRQYICDRLGLDLSYEELIKNKIVFSLKELLWKNYIKEYTRDSRVVDILDKYFIGFLSNNNTSISMRNVVYNKIQLPNNLNFRYMKYLIIQGAPAGYYIIPSICDITKRIEIAIAEGQFDILSIFYNVYGGDRNNRVYCSIGGNSYLNAIKYFLCDIGLVNPIFHIYIDNDIKKFVLPEIERLLKPLRIETHIHINAFTNEKDFGVSKNRIKEYYYRMI